MWILLVVFINTNNNMVTVDMQEFNTQETCQAVGSKIWEFSGRKANWACSKK